MTFAWFRKHEKLFLWFAVAFTVLVFALFSAMSGVERVLQGDEEGMGDVAGTFQVATTGETVEVSLVEFRQAAGNYARLVGLLFRNTRDIDDDDIWAHLIGVADARGAGLKISDDELLQSLTGGQVIDKRSYEQMVLGSQFASVRAFENFYRDFLLVARWMNTRREFASLVPADEVYQRWRVDNELFDLEALVFPDLDPASIPDPGVEVLAAWFDELPEFRRTSLFSEPARYDIAFAYLPFDLAGDELLAALTPELRATVTEPTDAEIQQRFMRVKAQRYAELTAPDDAARAALRNELVLQGLCSAAHTAFRQLPAHDLENFRSTMESYGLAVIDPEGLLGPDELKVLEPIGDELLPLRMQSMVAVGDSQSILSLTGKEKAAAVVLLQALTEAVPQDFEAAGADVLEEWRLMRVDQAARDFREGLKASARALPVVAEAIAPLEQQAAEAAEAAIAEALAAVAAGPGAEPVTEEAMADMRQAELDAIQPEIDLRIAEHEHEVWAAAVAGLGEGFQRLEYQAVPRSYQRTLKAEERDATSLEQFIKGNFAVFQLDTEGITDVLRFVAGKASVVVRVVGRSFPDQAAMAADTTGMLAARQAQSMEKLTQAAASFEPAEIMRAHGLRVPQKPAASPEAPASGEGVPPAGGG